MGSAFVSGKTRVLSLLEKLSGYRLVRTSTWSQESLSSIRSNVNSYVREASGDIVQSGPFEGMSWPETTPRWMNDSDAARLLGSYEEEIHPLVEKLIKWNPEFVVNFGCAEGFYAIGLARRLPKTTVLAVDIDAIAREDCTVVARRNGVEGRVEVLAQLEPERLPWGRTAWFMDIEGGEDALLDPKVYPSLTDALIIVEVHEFTREGLLNRLKSRFEGTHDIVQVNSGSRDPNRFPLLRSRPDTEKWTAVIERRPEAMQWLLLQPLSDGATSSP